MENARFSIKNGKEIFTLRFASNDTAEMLKLLEECARQVHCRPSKSVMILTIVEGAKFSTELTSGLKNLAKANEPYVHKAAAVGITGLYKVAINAISLFSKRDFKLFNTEDEAVAYLAQ